MEKFFSNSIFFPISENTTFFFFLRKIKIISSVLFVYSKSFLVVKSWVF